MSSCGPSCAPRSATQKELHEKLAKLREEKEQLDVKLNGESCQVDPIEEQLEAEKARLSNVTNKVECLKATKAKLEAKIGVLQERSAERTKNIDTLSQTAETEKTKLQGEMDRVTKEFQTETQGRFSVQAKIVNAYEQHAEAQCEYIPKVKPAPSSCALNANAAQPYAGPYDATVQRPARYVQQNLRQNPIRAIPFPNNAMDEAEGYGQEGSCSLRR